MAIKFRHEYWSRATPLLRREVTGVVGRGANAKGCAFQPTFDQKMTISVLLLGGSEVLFDGFAYTQMWGRRTVRSGMRLLVNGVPLVIRNSGDVQRAGR